MIFQSLSHSLFWRFSSTFPPIIQNNPRVLWNSFRVHVGCSITSFQVSIHPRFWRISILDIQVFVFGHCPHSSWSYANLMLDFRRYYWCIFLTSGSFQVLRITTNCIWWRKGRQQFNLELFHQQLCSSCSKLSVNLVCNATERKAHSPLFFIPSVTSWKDSFAFWWPPPPASFWWHIKEHKRHRFNWNLIVWFCD